MKWFSHSNNIINLERVTYIKCFMKATERACDVPTIRIYFTEDDFTSIYFETAKDMEDYFKELQERLIND